MKQVFGGGSVRAGDRIFDWIAVEDGRITEMGTGDAPKAHARVDLEGGVLIPAFCDAHVHLPATGLYAAGMDFRGERSVAAIQRSFRERALDPGAILFGGNFEDPLDEPVDRGVLDEAVGERQALLARADMHSCVVSSALLNELDVERLEGVDRDEHGHPSGYLREKAAAEAWRWFETSLPRPQLQAAIVEAAARAAAKGVTSVHEMFVVEWRGWDALEWFWDAVEAVDIEVVVYVATEEVKRVRDMGLDRVGGDLFLDGSFGSHTAWMADPYDPPPPVGSPPAGISYRDGDVLLDVFMVAQECSMQVGVHAIGDAAIEQAISTWEQVAAHQGEDSVRALGHRIEHFECATDDHIRRAAQLGLTASVQPAFDLFWGGPDGLYSGRIGWDRARSMNRFRSILDAGVVVGAGSDSTVTPLDPFLQMQALRSHHVPDERVDGLTALDLHTRGSNALGGRKDRGGIAPGAEADLALLSADPVTTEPDELTGIEVWGTWRAGRRIHPEGDRDG